MMKQQIEDLRQKQKVVLEKLIALEVSEENARERRESKCRSETERKRIRREHENARKLSKMRISTLVNDVLGDGVRSKISIQRPKKAVSIDICREAAIREKRALIKSKKALKMRRGRRVQTSRTDRVHKLMSAKRRLINEYNNILRAERQAGRCTVRSSMSSISASSSVNSGFRDSDAMSVASLDTLPPKRVRNRNGWTPPPLDFSRLRRSK